MDWKDSNGNKLTAAKRPQEIVDALNKGAVSMGIMSRCYSLYSESKAKEQISNVPTAIYEDSRLVKYSPPKRIGKKIEKLISVLKENIDIFHNNYPDAAERFSDGKVFQLNQCHHNSTGVFFLLRHLASMSVIRDSGPIQIVLGYFTRRLPFGTQIGTIVVENDSVWLHDWHVWNYFQGVLIDMTAFSNGNLLPPDGDITSWGSSRDHVFIYPPKEMEYWGIPFESIENFNEFVGQVIWFKR